MSCTGRAEASVIIIVIIFILISLILTVVVFVFFLVLCLGLPFFEMGNPICTRFRVFECLGLG